MIDQFYIGRNNKRFGPFSATQLRDFAERGRLLPTDTVCRVGTEKAVLAGNVRKLFPPTPPKTHVNNGNTPSAVEAPTPPGTDLQADLPTSPHPLQESVAEASPIKASVPLWPDSQPECPGLVPLGPPPAKAGSVSRPPEAPRKRRAVGVKGVVIISQDGEYVHFRKKCVQCGHEDACRSTQLIMPGINRANFYCPKCRKSRAVEMQGMMQ